MPQTIKKSAWCLFVLAVVLMYPEASTLAQGTKSDDYPKIEIFAGYSVLGDPNKRGISFSNDLRVSGNYTSTAGFEASITRNFTRYVGLKADFSAHFNNERGSGTVVFCNPICNSATQDLTLKTRVYNFLAGPEIKARNHTRFTPFAYALGGLAHTSARFTTPGPTFNLLIEKSNNGFAMALGGGLDIRASRRISFRGSIDYNPVFIDDPTGGTRDFVRISLGVLVH